MEQKTYQTNIAAPVQKVWDTMLKPETYQQWTGAAWPGSMYEGRWQQGETIDFISADGSGTRAFIKELSLNESVYAEHIAILLPGGIADTESESAKNWIGIKEDYFFSETNGVTKLTVSITASPQCLPMFDEGFPKALNKLREMCELQ